MTRDQAIKVVSAACAVNQKSEWHGLGRVNLVSAVVDSLIDLGLLKVDQPVSTAKVVFAKPANHADISAEVTENELIKALMSLGWRRSYYSRLHSLTRLER